MICTIEWRDINAKEEWTRRYKLLRRANLLQSFPYAAAMCAHKGYILRPGIIKIDGDEAGIVLALEAGALGNLLHAVMLDRGPLWFDGYGSAAHKKLFLEEFNRLFPRRLGCRRRIIPEMPDNEEVQSLMKSSGYRRVSAPGYETVWLDLAAADLLADMDKDWRRRYKKAKENGPEIVWDNEGRYLDWFLKVYALDKAKRGYSGPEPGFLKRIAENFMADREGGYKAMIGRAILNGGCMAAALILRHGASATYQAGWCSEEGRKANANHLLLGEALFVLKNEGVRHFDLGGVNDETASGVKKFKMDMGGELVRLAGLYG